MMRIAKLTEKINSVRDRVRNTLAHIDERAILIAIVLLATTGAFMLGRLSMGKPSAPIMVTEEDFNAVPIATYAENQKSREVSEENGSVVASKNGGKYHLPWCAGAQRIKRENLIHFASSVGAKAAGYEPAANCPGLNE